MPFAPDASRLMEPLESETRLLRVDPGLPLACAAVLKGQILAPMHIRFSDDEYYLRRIAARQGPDGRINQLVVSYAPSEIESFSKLKKVQNLLRNAIEAFPDPVAYFDQDDRLVICNKAYAELHTGSQGTVSTNMTFEEVLRLDLAHGALEIPSDAQEAWLTERLSSREKPVFSRELRLPDQRWFRITERATEDGGRVHVLTSITSLKRAQIYLRDVVAGAQVGTWRLDMESGEGTVNNYWAEMLGYDYTLIEPIGYKEWRNMVHPDDLTTVETAFQTCLTGSAKSWEVEYRMRHRAGHWVWLLGRGGVSEWNTDGTPRQVAGVHLDISQKKSLEADLRLRNSAINSAEDGITITDAAGIILDTNPAHAKMFAYETPQDLIGKPWYELYCPDVAASLAADAFPTLRATGHWKGEALALRLDGNRFEQDLSLAEMPDGKIVCVSRDVSARNALERSRIELKDRIQKAQRHEITNLLSAGLTHDLYNLTAIISYMSEPGYVNAQETDLHKTLMDIHRMARDIISLVAPIRDLGQRQTKSEDTDLRAALKQASELLKLGGPQDLSVKISLPETPIWTEVHSMQMMQILLNLGLNAREALNGEKKEVELSVFSTDRMPPDATIEIGTVPPCPFALLAVRDTGSGISDAVRKRLWTPNFTTKGDQGTGLGLAVVAEIVKEAGGCVALTTEVGQGSTFFVAWPLENDFDHELMTEEDTPT